MQMAPFLVALSLLLAVAGPTASRPLDPIPTTTVLNVASSLRLAHSILDFDPSSLSTQEEKPPAAFFPNSTGAGISLELRPRDAILNSGHRNYASLLRSRLSRDAARVSSLHARHQLSLADDKVSDLKPRDNQELIQPEASLISAPLTSGIGQGSGEYFARIGVGTPARSMYMVVDTGSDVTWLQCKPCFECYSQTDPIFDPTTSSSYSPLPCSSSQCSALDASSCRSGDCLYQVNYGDGSFTFGDFSTDTLSFAGSSSAPGIALGCGHDNEGLFVGAAGLIGLGGGSLSLTSQLKANSFSYCLVNRDSQASSTLDFDAPPPAGGGAAWAPLVRSSKIKTFFYVALEGISVGGRGLDIPSSVFQIDESSGDGGVIVDCGTAVTRLRDEAYAALRDAFVSMTGHLRRKEFGVELFDTCYDLTGMSSVSVPTLAFQFAGGRSWILPTSNYLIPVDDPGTYCLAFAPTSSSLSIIGNVQQQGTRVAFDLANNRVSFSPNQC